jgi:hypothetical protein
MYHNPNHILSFRRHKTKNKNSDFVYAKNVLTVKPFHVLALKSDFSSNVVA